MILVTGAGGFIGSHLVEELLRFTPVRAMCHYNAAQSIGNLALIDPQLPSPAIVFGDIRDRDCVYDAVRGCNFVFHLAALIDVPHSFVTPDAYMATNAGGTLNILQACRDLRVPVVITSTSEVYGTARQRKMRENHRLNAQSPYAASKIAADQMALAFNASFRNSQVAILRPFNTYGPWQSSRAVIPSLIRQLGTSQIAIMGNPNPIRDFLYVDDTVHGFICLMDNFRKCRGKVIHIGTGRETRVGDLPIMIAKIMGHDARAIASPQLYRPRKAEVKRLCCDWSYAKRMIAWEPQVSLEDGLRATIHAMGFNQAEEEPEAIAPAPNFLRETKLSAQDTQWSEIFNKSPPAGAP